MPTAAMASSLLLRPRASFRRTLPPPPPSSRRALPATLLQAASTQQKQPGLSARSYEGERRQPAGTRLYSLAPYPLLLAALLPGGMHGALFFASVCSLRVRARSVAGADGFALSSPAVSLALLWTAEPVTAVFAPFVELVKTLDLPGWLVHWGHPGNMVLRLSFPFVAFFTSHVFQVPKQVWKSVATFTVRMLRDRILWLPEQRCR